MADRYRAPRLTAYGDVDELTSVFGDPSSGDVAYDLSGDVVETDGLSVDGSPNTPPSLPPAPSPA